jgi:CubicO group peptidase (beta-lactamase class C family)
MKSWFIKHHLFAFKLAVSLSVAFTFNLIAFAQAKPDASSLSAQVDKVFAQWDKPTSPGCALAVIKDGSIVYKRGYGMADLDHDIPITSTSVFHVASVSKQFTAMAIHLLAKEGKLSLDDEVRKYITELSDFGDKITIRHLLHHTSGLRDQWNLLIMAGWRLSEDVVKDDDVLELISRQKGLNFKPGDQHLYSNTGYTLMAIIVKRVSGQSLREFSDAKIFKPLGMNNTFFRDDHLVVVKNQAYAYSPSLNNSFKLSVPNYDTVGASSLLTTVEDLAKWDQNFYDFRVGSKEIIDQMQQTTALNDGEKFPYAHGLVIGNYKGLKLVEHSGGDAGYRSHLMRFPEQKFSIACTCNSANTPPGQLSRHVADLYLKDLLKADAPKTDSAIAEVTLTEQQLKNKVGVYWYATTGSFGKVSMKDGKLFLTSPGGGTELVPLSENRFRLKGQPTEVMFSTRQDGTASQMSVTQEGRKPSVFEVQEEMTPTPEQLKEYVGAYYSDELDAVYKVEIEGDKLVLKRKKYLPTPYSVAFKDAFNNPAMGTFQFTRDSQKRINGFVINAGRIRNFRFTKSSS